MKAEAIAFVRDAATSVARSVSHESNDARSDAEDLSVKLSKVLESTLDCVFSLDRDWRFTYLNRRAEAEIFRNEALLGRRILDAFPQLEDTPFWEAYQQVMREREPRQVEGFMPGLNHWYEVHAAPLDDGITVFFRNIDERKRAEEIIRRSEARLRDILAHIPQMVWATRSDGYHDYYNPPWYEFTGVPVGSTDGEEWNEMFHPDDRERAWDEWRRSIRTGEPYEIEYRLRHHSGEYRWVLGRACPEKDEQGKIVRWYGTCTDVHDRVNAQQALHDSRSLQECVLDASADCIKIILPDGALDYMNGPGLRALELEKLETVRGRKWVSFLPEGDRATAQEAVDKALSGQASRFTGPLPNCLR